MIVGSLPSTPSVHILIAPRRRRIRRHSSTISIASLEPLFRPVNACTTHPVSLWAKVFELLVTAVHLGVESLFAFIHVVLAHLVDVVNEDAHSNPTQKTATNSAEISKRQRNWARRYPSGRGHARPGPGNQSSRIGKSQRTREGVTIRIDAAAKPDSIRLDVSTDSRIVVSEVVVVCRLALAAMNSRQRKPAALFAKGCRAFATCGVVPKHECVVFL